MHEMSITESILQLALEKAGEAEAAKVTKINLVIGDLAGIAGECVQFYFNILAKETIAAGAELCIERQPVQARCRDCGTVYEPREGDWSCLSCGKTAVDVIAGRECHMTSLEVD